MVQGRRFSNLGAKIVANHFEITAGTPVDKGGDDEGPSPHEILEAALSACTIITAQMYANRKQWKLESTEVKVEILSESKEETKISRQVTFNGDLNDEQRTRLADIIERCPIHLILESHISIDTKVVEPVAAQ